MRLRDTHVDERTADGNTTSQKTHHNNSQNVSTPWDPRVSRVPVDWTQAAGAVSMGDQPLSHVVDILFQLAQ